MIAALCAIGAGVLVALGFVAKEWIAGRSRAKIEEIAASLLAVQARKDAEIDADKTPKPRTEEEISDELKARHPPTHRIVR